MIAELLPLASGGARTGNSVCDSVPQAMLSFFLEVSGVLVIEESESILV